LKGLSVADGALYSADNLTTMTGMRWLTRVSLSIKAAATLVDEVVELTPSVIKGYAGKPIKDAVPSRISHHVTGTLIANQRETIPQQNSS
jgi:hypothetical protein